jgi:hypothetical protein
MTAALFITLAVITVVSFIALIVFICLYVYTDASVNSDKPGLWVLITALTPNLFGFLIYMLVGRKKERTPVKKFKTPAIISAAAVVISTAVFLGTVLFGSDIPVINNVSIGMVNNNIGSQWYVSYRSSGTTLERTVSLSGSELDNFTVEASCDEGEMYLLLLQGRNVKVVDITDFPQEKISMDDFEPGNVKLSLYNESAKNAKIQIDW